MTQYHDAVTLDNIIASVQYIWNSFNDREVSKYYVLMASATMTIFQNPFRLHAALPPWPNAEQCCSEPDLDHPQADMRCCLMLGDANSICFPIEEKIKRCLHERKQELYRRRRSFPGYSVKCYMTGTDKATSRPVTLIASVSQSFRNKIQEVIEDSIWWREFRLAHPAFGGFLHAKWQPRLLAIGDNPTLQTFAYVQRNTIISFGAKLFFVPEIDTTADHPVKPSRSVLGGFILVDDAFYGLTVSHVLSDHTAEPDTSLGRLSTGDFNCHSGSPSLVRFWLFSRTSYR